MRLVDRIFDGVLPYRLCQATHARQKLVPFLKANDTYRSRRVLDVGCGPGTNAGYFFDSEYVGVDLSLKYLQAARRRHGRSFVVADVIKDPIGRGDFDVILVNSLLHHLSDESVHIVLSRLGSLLSPDGCIHVIDLVLPSRRSVGRSLALLDRGDYPRSLEQWRGILETRFERVLFKPYVLTALRIPLWNMVYFKGRGKRA